MPTQSDTRPSQAVEPADAPQPTKVLRPAVWHDVSDAIRRTMQSNRGKDTAPERALRSLVHSIGYRFRKHVRGLPGTPDLVFPARRKAVWNTPTHDQPRPAQTVHPRVRGEHCGARMRGCTCDGSSPRARGTLDPANIEAFVRRFIPACAGNTSPAIASCTSITVHPRVRGEHISYAPQKIVEGGSSPRARGTRVLPSGPEAHMRFIPACAGNTDEAKVRQIASDGSSPRARGTRRNRLRGQCWARFIPACAGNTSPPLRGYRLQSVHPRVRGEHARTSSPRSRAAGSSPRARGTLVARAQTGACRRFIPACAGNTYAHSLWPDLVPVHPRVRGEHARHE